MSPGDICLAYFPFGGRVGTKLRPALLLTGPVGTVPEYLVAYITSIKPPQFLPSDIMLDPNSPAGAGTNLKAVSWLRLHKLATIHGSNISQQVGTLSPTLQNDVDTKLRSLLRL